MRGYDNMRDLITVAIKPVDGLHMNTYQGVCILNEYCPILNKTLTVSEPVNNIDIISPILFILIGLIIVITIGFFIKNKIGGGQTWKINS